MLLGFGAIFDGVYRGSFRIDFLGFGNCFFVCVCVFLFGGIFWVFSVMFWVFFCADFMVFWFGFYVIALGFFSGSDMIYT